VNAARTLKVRSSLADALSPAGITLGALEAAGLSG
jgi:hypothetical protein